MTKSPPGGQPWVGAKDSYLILVIAANLTISEALLGANQGFQTWVWYQSDPFRVAFQLAFWVYLVVLIVLGLCQRSLSSGGANSLISGSMRPRQASPDKPAFESRTWKLCDHWVILGVTEKRGSVRSLGRHRALRVQLVIAQSKGGQCVCGTRLWMVDCPGLWLAVVLEPWMAPEPAPGKTMVPLVPALMMLGLVAGAHGD
ncbi:hypothetical protein GH733_015435, partial [Mirounga leonina]